mmetsp:Transcript_11708/g.13343  ORF Transcript_11708/g.13343 Transcript_11708/m.13343 type:complete len:236 (+) Transcript_11708:37-744(+)
MEGLHPFLFDHKLDDVTRSPAASASTSHFTEKFAPVLSLLIGRTIAQGYGGGSFMVTLYAVAVSFVYISVVSLPRSTTLAKLSFKILFLDAPAPQNKTIRAASFNTGNVNVILRGGIFGESSIGATNRDCSVNKPWPGKSEQVCPSGPKPSTRQSIFPPPNFSTSFTFSSYDAATAPESDRSVWSMLWIWFSGISTLARNDSRKYFMLESSSVSDTIRSSAKITCHLSKRGSTLR